MGRWARVVLWGLLAAMGALWTLQGFDLVGQDGGMNGRSEWVVIGLMALVGGAGMAYRAVRSPGA